jgi:hypothetical protein
MPELHRFRVDLGGWIGAPGVNTLYFRYPLGTGDLDSVAGLIRTAYDSLKAYFPAGMTATVNSEVAVIDSATGLLQHGEVLEPPAQVVGTAGSASSSRAVMALARLHTQKVIDGRRVRGRIFLGPIATTAMAADGSISSAVRNAIGTAFGGLIDVAGANLVVWHRPTAPGASDGDYGTVTSVIGAPLPEVLRSRRD